MRGRKQPSHPLPDLNYRMTSQQRRSPSHNAFQPVDTRMSYSVAGPDCGYAIPPVPHVRTCY